MRPKNPGSTPTEDQPRDPASVLAASSFNTGLQLLPASLQRDARALYLLLRTIDDLVDECRPEAEKRVRAMELWALGEPPTSPEAHTLEQLSQRYDISRLAVGEFCEGMRHDLNQAEMETEQDLERYCHCVAGTVGVLLAGLLGPTSKEGTAKMAILGAAMQRTNILRDIDEDLAHGRLYIPRTLIDQYGLPLPGAREQLLREQIPQADALYEQGMGAIPLLGAGRQAMGLATVLYREILRQLERDGYGRKPGRATVPTWRKTTIANNYLRARPTTRQHNEPHPMTVER
jgi:phytoene synthase